MLWFWSIGLGSGSYATRCIGLKAVQQDGEINDDDRSSVPVTDDAGMNNDNIYLRPSVFRAFLKTHTSNHNRFAVLSTVIVITNYTATSQSRQPFPAFTITNKDAEPRARSLLCSSSSYLQQRLLALITSQIHFAIGFPQPRASTSTRIHTASFTVNRRALTSWLWRYMS